MSRLACLAVVFGLLLTLGAASVGIEEPATLRPRILIASAFATVAITVVQEMRQLGLVTADTKKLSALSAGRVPAQTASPDSCRCGPSTRLP